MQQIRDVQRTLKSEGFDPGPIDGFIGPQTRRAVTEFQQTRGLEPTGRLNSRTLAPLEIDIQTPTTNSSPSALPSDNQQGVEEPGVNRYGSDLRGKQS